MPVKLANIAREVGAGVLEGNVTFPSDNRLRNVGAVDFETEVIHRLRCRRVMIIVADQGEAEHEDAARYTCVIIGFTMNELSESPWRKMQNQRDTAPIAQGKK